VPLTGFFYLSELQLRCNYTHLITKNDLSPSQLLSFRHSKIARITWRYMDVYQNIDFFIFPKEICLISLSKKRSA